MLRTAFTFACLLALAASATSAELKVGDKAPDFSLVGSDGKTYKLADFKGKYVVIAWFPKAFTGGCTAECKSMREHGDLIRKYDVAYFTASVDPADQNTAFAKSLSLDYPILSDPTKEVATAYGLIQGRPVATRWTYYIDPEGKIAYIDKAINTASAAEDIAARLKKLKAPAAK